MDSTLKEVINKIDRGEKLTEEDIKSIELVIPGVVNALEMAIKYVGELILMVSRGFKEWISPIVKWRAEIEAKNKEILATCPNKRVVHLARYAKKYRTRKKNLNRAYKIVNKGKV